MPMPWLDRSDVSFPARQSPDFHLASPVFLRVAGADLLTDPFSVRGLLEEENTFVGGGEDLLFAVHVPIYRPDVVGDVKLVTDDLTLPGFFEGARGAAEDIERGAIALPPLRSRGVTPVERRTDSSFLRLPAACMRRRR